MLKFRIPQSPPAAATAPFHKGASLPHSVAYRLGFAWSGTKPSRWEMALSAVRNSAPFPADSIFTDKNIPPPDTLVGRGDAYP